MEFFSKSLKIGEGQKYDLSKVSANGVTEEEITNQKKKLLDIFKAFDKDGDGKLSTTELSKAMDCFENLDKDDNLKLSNKELNTLVEVLNKNGNLNGKDAIKTKDLKEFIKNIINTQNAQLNSGEEGEVKLSIKMKSK